MYGYSSRFAKQLFSSTSVTAALGPVITKYRRGILTRKPQAKSTCSSPPSPSPSRQQLCEPFRPCSGADQDLARSSRTFNCLLTEHMARQLATSPENPPFSLPVPSSCTTALHLTGGRAPFLVPQLKVPAHSLECFWKMWIILPLV